MNQQMLETNKQKNSLAHAKLKASSHAAFGFHKI